jgi:hypothetical protein
MLQWRNSRPRRARSALGRSRQGIPSSSAAGAWAISFVVGLVFRAPRSGLFSLSNYCRDRHVAECVRCAGRFHQREVASIDQFGIRSHGCSWCHADLTDSIRAHLYGCALLPVAVRRRAQVARAAAQRLVQQSGQLSDRADVLLREAEAALYALRDTMRQPRSRSGTKHPGRQISLSHHVLPMHLDRGA